MGQSDDAFLNRFEEISGALMSKDGLGVLSDVGRRCCACRQMSSPFGQVAAASMEANYGPRGVRRADDSDGPIHRRKATRSSPGGVRPCSVIMMEYRPKCRDFMDSMGLTISAGSQSSHSRLVLDRVDVCLRTKHYFARRCLIRRRATRRAEVGRGKDHRNA